MKQEESRWPSRQASYERFELVIENWADLRFIIDELGETYSSRRLYWRGARRADWPLFSSLYLTLKEELGRSPSEQELVHAERVILSRARHDWRYDDLSALEIFARLQHVGGPTRLIDVTANPLIGAWFAVEDVNDHDLHDARLFAFASGNRQIHLHRRWADRDPWWHMLKSNAARVATNWGTGRDIRVWTPPAYDNRIAAQQAAFILDGSPVSLTADSRGEDERSNRSWSLSEARETSSINIRLKHVHSSELADGATPVFTLRILAGARRQIREQLENHYGYRASAVYPDFSGLSGTLNGRPTVLVRSPS